MPAREATGRISALRRPTTGEHLSGPVEQRFSSISRATAAVLLISWTVASGAQVCKAYPRSGGPSDAALVRLADGTAWYTDVAGNRLVRINPDKSETAIVPVDASTVRLSGLAVGPGNQLWYSKDTSKRVGRIPLTGGEGLEFALPGTGNALPSGIVAGPDGTLWFYDPIRNGVARVAPDGSVTELRGPEFQNRRFAPSGLAVAADGTLWTTASNHNAVYRVAPGGSFTRFDIASPAAQPGQIAAAPDGSFWFTMPAIRALGRITRDGSITEHQVGKETPTHVAVGDDGTVWFAMKNYSMLGWIRPGGGIEKIRCGSNPGALAIGADAKPWALGNRSLLVVEDIGSNAAASSTTRKPVAVPPVPGAPAAERMPTIGADAVERVGSDELARRISGSTGQLIVHITSFDPHCSFCVHSNPPFDAFAARNRERAAFIRYHSEPWGSIIGIPLMKQLGIAGVPIILVFENGNEVKRVAGYQSGDNLDRLIFGAGR